MAVSVTGKVLLDTNVFIDYLRADLHGDWIFGGMSNTIRFLSAVVPRIILFPIRPNALQERKILALVETNGSTSKNRVPGFIHEVKDALDSVKRLLVFKPPSYIFPDLIVSARILIARFMTSLGRPKMMISGCRKLS
jgi:hypothetical protein